ncbi:MAG: anaerobic sulfatase maturase [Chloroflexi bacterium]|nr:anaerobic sulfatase maturase [Chloroflexota bacterium]MBP7044233.1 anaerobic sulfatase maturase [Chloroflexota bacterium]
MNQPISIQRPPQAPPAFHLLAKPTGAICNLDCAYCFFLDKEVFYPGSKFRMSEPVLEQYIRQLIESHQTNSVNIAWQGGEPTLMGLDFYRRTMDLVEKYRRPGMTFLHTMQTNGTLLNDEWAAFFAEHNFLLGISIDGPRPLHDIYRVDKGGKPTFDNVMRGLRLLQKHNVDYNVLTTVNRINGDYPLEVYRFLRDEVGTTWMQFIPVVERINADGLTLYQEGTAVSDRSVQPEQFGRFLSTIFDEWVRRDVGTIYVQTFEAALSNWLGMPNSGMCVFNATCGTGLAIEHNGDLYSCDHFVEPNYFLGNIQETHMIELVASPQQIQFGLDKRDSLPRYCQECDVRFACHGECPKNRFIQTPDGEPGLNYLCVGFKEFFHHVDFPMKLMAGLIRRGREAREVMQILDRAFTGVERNAPCPCGNGRKFKQCHGRPQPTPSSKPLPAPQSRSGAVAG